MSFIKTAYRVRKREGVNANHINILRTISAKFLDYKEKEEIIRRCYKFKDTGYSVRGHFCKEIVEIPKKLWDQVKKMREDGKYEVVQI